MDSSRLYPGHIAGRRRHVRWSGRRPGPGDPPGGGQLGAVAASIRGGGAAGTRRRAGEPRGGAGRAQHSARAGGGGILRGFLRQDRKSTRLNSSHLVISYAVFCFKKKKNNKK